MTADQEKPTETGATQTTGTIVTDGTATEGTVEVETEDDLDTGSVAIPLTTGKILDPEEPNDLHPEGIYMIEVRSIRSQILTQLNSYRNEFNVPPIEKSDDEVSIYFYHSIFTTQ